MRRALQITLLCIFAASAIAGVAIGYVLVDRVIDEQIELEVDLVHKAISAKFQKFDVLLRKEEELMDARMEAALQVVAGRLLGGTREISEWTEQELGSLSKEVGVDNVYVIDNKTRIVATDFAPDKGFELGTISDGLRSFLIGLIGTAEIVPDRINFSSKTGILKKYGYFSPTNSAHIAEVSIDVRRFLSEERSTEFVDFLFSGFFKELVDVHEHLVGIDIHMINQVAAFSLFDRNQNIPGTVVEHLRENDIYVTENSFSRKVYSRLSPAQTSLSTAEFLIVSSEFDFSVLARRVEQTVLMLVGMMILASGLAYLVAIRLATRRVIDRVEAVRAGVSRIADGDFGFEFFVRGRDEINDIVDDINLMKLRIAADMEQRESSNIKLTAAIQEAEAARTISEEQGVKLVQLAEQEAELRMKAEQAESAKSEFLASMSHEIRTPMTGVMGFADLLLEGNLEQESREKVYKIKDATRSLLRIINDILDMSKMEAGKMEIENIDFHLPSLIKDVAGLFGEKRSGKRAKNVELTIELDDDFPVGVNGDPTRVRQILVNLIGNAMKFTEKGSVTVKGALEAVDGKEFYKIAITDTGIGMKPEVMNDLFEEFTQADASITRRFEGTGLGLTICKRLAKLMGGSIGADSEYGKGSTFWFTLPYAQATSEVSPGGAKINEAVSNYKALRPLHTLIVDDNKLNQQIIFATMVGFGHTVQIAENGLEAIDAHERGDFDLILMDIRMPVMSGTEATKLIRQMDEEKAHIPIIALTADAMKEHRKGYFEAGVNEVATKPIDRAELASAINDAMGEEIHVPDIAASNDDINVVDDAPSEEEIETAVSDFLKQIGAEASDA